MKTRRPDLKKSDVVIYWETDGELSFLVAAAYAGSLYDHLKSLNVPGLLSPTECIRLTDAGKVTDKIIAADGTLDEASKWLDSWDIPIIL